MQEVDKQNPDHRNKEQTLQNIATTDFQAVQLSH
jgi:hypothetical protein